MEKVRDKMVGISSKAGFEGAYKSLIRSRVRTEILMYLHQYYPKASYPSEIARDTGIALANVLGGLKGMGRFDAPSSLLNQGVVEEMEQGDTTSYRLSERGKSLVESMFEAK
jgi:predicted transcriptional regulator with HTH domain